MIETALRAHLMARVLKDPAFRQAVLNSPRAVLASEYQIQFPAHLAVRVLEEVPDAIIIVLPPLAENIQELADSDLEAIAGGIEWSTYGGATCDYRCRPD